MAAIAFQPMRCRLIYSVEHWRVVSLAVQGARECIQCSRGLQIPAAFQALARVLSMLCRYNMEIVDTVLIPPDLEAGDWVLGWRYDCEESSQVWSSCSGTSE